MNNSKIKVLIVEDEVLIAKHLEDALLSSDYMPIGIAHDSETALDFISNREPDFIILDINIDGQRDGIELAEIVKKDHDIPFIFLTALSDLSTLDRAKKANPCGYIVKPFKTKDLISSITIGMYNYNYKQNKEELNIDAVNALSVEDLTTKEFEVLKDILEGFTNAQIAKKQFVSISTIKFHCQNIYSKMDVPNRSSAIKKVLRL